LVGFSPVAGILKREKECERKTEHSRARATINRQVDSPTTATDVGVDEENVDDEEGTN
jgi:hypothetical protein